MNGVSLRTVNQATLRSSSMISIPVANGFARRESRTQPPRTGFTGSEPLETKERHVVEAKRPGSSGLEFEEPEMPPPRVIRERDPGERMHGAPASTRAVPMEPPGTAVSPLGAFWYPLRGPGPVMIAIGAVALVALDIMSYFGIGGIPIGWFVAVVLGGGFFGAYYFDIVADTMGGRDKVSDWPDVVGGWGDLFRSLFRLAGLLCIAFGPYFVISRLIEPETWWYRPVSWGTLIGGFIYFPMAVLGAQALGGFQGAMPHVTVPAIVRCMPGYLIPVGIGVAAYVALEIVELLVVGIPIVGGLVAGAVSLYALMAQARIIGLIYRRHRVDLGWGDATYD